MKQFVISLFNHKFSFYAGVLLHSLHLFQLAVRAPVALCAVSFHLAMGTRTAHHTAAFHHAM